MADYTRAIGRGGERGFTLMEVLVAFSILTVALGGLLLAFTNGLRTTERAVTISTATLQAQSLLEAVGKSIPVREGRTDGILEDGSRWRISMERYDTGESGTAAVVRTLFAFRVEVSVEWDDGRSVTLTSLRLGAENG